MRPGTVLAGVVVPGFAACVFVAPLFCVFSGALPAPAEVASAGADPSVDEPGPVICVGSLKLGRELSPSSVGTPPVGVAAETVSEARPKPSLLQRSSYSVDEDMS